MRAFITLIVLCSTITIPSAQVFDAIVAQDGSGGFTSISQALNHRAGYTGIFIKNGVYDEKLSLSRDGVSLIGESQDGVIIQWDDHANDGTHSTGTSYTLLIDGDDVYMENITVKNTAGNVGQAVAVHTKGQRVAVKNCKFIGFQDSYYVDGAGMVYTQDTFIEGATDFIFGDATAVFQDCQINCVNGGQYITAPADPKLITQGSDGSVYHGTLFLNCNITADSDVSDNSYYLGRPWQPNSSSIYVNCTLGNHIRDIGWSTWNDNTHQSGLYAEYNSMETDGAAVDVSGRAEWSVQLTEDQVTNYYNRDYYLTKDGNTWDPIAIIASLPAPANVSAMSPDEAADIIQWSAVDGAKGYAILRDGVVVGFSETASFTDESANVNVSRAYTVKSVSESGALSGASAEISVEARNPLSNQKKIPDEIRVYSQNGEVFLSERADVVVYSLSGNVVFEEKNTDSFALAANLRGVYVIKIKAEGRLPFVKKIVL